MHIGESVQRVQDYGMPLEASQGSREELVAALEAALGLEAEEAVTTSTILDDQVGDLLLMWFQREQALMKEKTPLAKLQDMEVCMLSFQKTMTNMQQTQAWK